MFYCVSRRCPSSFLPLLVVSHVFLTSPPSCPHPISSFPSPFPPTPLTFSPSFCPLPSFLLVLTLTLCRSNSPIGILSIELQAVLDGKVKTLPSNTTCSSMESIPIGLLDRQRVKTIGSQLKHVPGLPCDARCCCYLLVAARALLASTRCVLYRPGPTAALGEKRTCND